MTESAAAGRVIVADDSAEARALIVELLREFGYRVVAEVDSGPDAVTHALEQTPDVVLLDVHMPGGSGIDAAKEITARLPGTAIVLVSGDETLRLTDADILETATVSMLPKPVTASSLNTTVRSAVHQSRVIRAALAEAAAARQALEDRKTIERAKGLLMRRTGCTEQEAYRILQRTSQDKSVPMVAVARAVIDSEPGHGPSSASRATEGRSA